MVFTQPSVYGRRQFGDPRRHGGARCGDGEPRAPSSEDYRDFAMKRIAAERRPADELKLKNF
jgi:hypothetical protein